jgi:prepilin-type N-terminal cleavage/methylation domain-containing protein
MRPARRHAVRRAAVRRGMTLVEVIVAIVILTGATLTMGGFISRFAHTASVSGIRATAAELAADRLETVKQAPTYAALEETYRGDEATIAGHPGFRRATVISHVARSERGGLDDYMLVTVVVTHASLGAPVKKTTIISAF